MTPPEAWPSTTHHWRCPEGSVYVVIAERDDKPYYVDVRVSKAGGSQVAASAYAIAVLAGSHLRRGLSPAKLRLYLKGISVATQQEVDNGDYDALSVPDALARTVEALYCNGDGSG